MSTEWRVAVFITVTEIDLKLTTTISFVKRKDNIGDWQLETITKIFQTQCGKTLKWPEKLLILPVGNFGWHPVLIFIKVTICVRKMVSISNPCLVNSQTNLLISYPHRVLGVLSLNIRIIKEPTIEIKKNTTLNS